MFEHSPRLSPINQIFETARCNFTPQFLLHRRITGIALFCFQDGQFTLLSSNQLQNGFMKNINSCVIKQPPPSPTSHMQIILSLSKV